MSINRRINQPKIVHMNEKLQGLVENIASSFTLVVMTDFESWMRPLWNNKGKVTQFITMDRKLR